MQQLLDDKKKNIYINIFIGDVGDFQGKKFNFL
jgi:hypothetical protein